MSEEQRDLENPGPHIAEMWDALGKRFEDYARNSELGLTADENVIGDAIDCMRFAAIAEACYWRATGNSEAADAQHVNVPLFPHNVFAASKEAP